jgi:Cu(I)/Ag(I) efflux system membrane protein CusA/SilA
MGVTAPLIVAALVAVACGLGGCAVAHRMLNRGDLVQAIHHGAVKRIRPKIMTISVIIAGLLPIMWSHGTGADVMKRIAAPMVGGVVTSGIMELLVYPVIFFIWRGLHLQKELTATSQGDIEED